MVVDSSLPSFPLSSPSATSILTLYQPLHHSYRFRYIPVPPHQHYISYIYKTHCFPPPHAALLPVRAHTHHACLHCCSWLYYLAPLPCLSAVHRLGASSATTLCRALPPPHSTASILAPPLTPSYLRLSPMLTSRPPPSHLDYRRLSPYQSLRNSNSTLYHAMPSPS